MSFLIRALTWIDHVVELSISATMRAVAAVLTRTLRRGRHRAWRTRSAS